MTRLWLVRRPATELSWSATARYRDGARRPETMLMGAAYQSWFKPHAEGGARFSYRVERTDLPFFQGSGLRVGDELAEVVGYEWDNRDPEGDGRRLWDEQKSAIPLLPPTTQFGFSSLAALSTKRGGPGSLRPFISSRRLGPRFSTQARSDGRGVLVAKASSERRSSVSTRISFSTSLPKRQIDRQECSPPQHCSSRSL